ncbi:MAG: tRNA pseudouridine(13) synthase TruD [Candidatus Bathyarchaeota archaeon]|nr:tRNA pseudouridine(13) synthase TruD [Candidatus Bathyarchaeota archaeon]
MPNLPYTTKGLPGTGGSIRELSGDFVVEEVPAFEPSGVGGHVFLNLTKRDINTREVARRLAGVFGLPMTAVGYAGLKDRNAVSTQTFSVHLPETEPGRFKDVEYFVCAELGVKVNWIRRHMRKLRTGQLKGNRFTINVTELEIGIGEALVRAEAISKLLGSVGMPNFYGPQRVDVVNVRSGYEVLKGRRKVKDRWLKRLLVSSYIDHLCNLYLARRLESGWFSRLIEGDIAKKASTGGMFTVEDVEAEQARYEVHEINFTAPIYGPKMWWASGPSGVLEREIFAGSGVTMEELGQLKVIGSRRLGRLIPEIDVQAVERGLQLRFFLPKGAYATMVLREFLKDDVR